MECRPTKAGGVVVVESTRTLTAVRPYGVDTDGGVLWTGGACSTLVNICSEQDRHAGQL